MNLSRRRLDVAVGRLPRTRQPSAALNLRRAAIAGVLVCSGMLGWAVAQEHKPVAETPAVANDPQNKPRPHAEFDHFLYLRHDLHHGSAKTDTLVLAKVLKDKIELRDVYVLGNLHIGWEPIAIHGGKIYGLKIGSLIAIDMATGAAQELAIGLESAVWNSGVIYAVQRGGPQALIVAFDVDSQSRRDVARLMNLSYDFRPQIKLSPDGRTLAVYEPLKSDLPSLDVEYRLHLVDLHGPMEGPLEDRLKPVGKRVLCQTFLTGGGSIAYGPQFAWFSDQQIVYAYNIERDQGIGGSPPMKLAVVSVQTGESRDVADLPQGSRSMGDPVFPKNSAGLQMMLQAFGRFSLQKADGTLREGKLQEDDRLAGQYRLVRQGTALVLQHGETRLGTLNDPPMGNVTTILTADWQWNGEASISPDEKRCVWWAGTTTSQPMSYHDAERGTVKVAQGWFTRSWTGSNSPDQNLIRWATSAQLQPKGATAPRDGWSKLTLKPWPEVRTPQSDTRPVADKMLSLEVQLDKTQPRLHEPVSVTIAVTNKSDKPVSFPRPSWRGSVLNVGLDSPRISSTVSEFENGWVESEEHILTIEPGKTLTILRPIETYGPGKNTLNVSIALPEWRGRLKKELEFDVVSSPDDAALFREKFDRLLARCRKEFDDEPARCNVSRIWNLGTDAAPLLVQHFETQPDVAFRQKMGQALAEIGRADTLIYYEHLLQGPMEQDVAMVTHGLFSQWRRKEAAEEAIDLLLTAARHARPEVRRAAVAELKQISDDKVQTLFETLVDDADLATGSTAARYLAARSNLDLAGWLGRCAAEPTQARLIALRDIVDELETTWKVKQALLPAGRWEEISRKPAEVEQYQRAVKEWRTWAEEHPRYSTEFFAKDRVGWEMPNGGGEKRRR